jgi:hypothetical protein
MICKQAPKQDICFKILLFPKEERRNSGRKVGGTPDRGNGSICWKLQEMRRKLAGQNLHSEHAQYDMRVACAPVHFPVAHACGVDTNFKGSDSSCLCIFRKQKRSLL